MTVLEVFRKCSAVPRPLFALQVLCALIDEYDTGSELVTRETLLKRLTEDKSESNAESNLGRVASTLSQAGLLVVLYRYAKSETFSAERLRGPGVLTYYQLPDGVLAAFNRKVFPSHRVDECAERS